MRAPFPGAVLGKSKAQHAGVKHVTAGKGELINTGEFDIVVEQLAGDRTKTLRKSTLQNSEVGIPMIGISNVTKQQHEVTFREHDGYSVHAPAWKKVRVRVR